MQKNSPAWIEAIKQKSQLELKARLAVLEGLVNQLFSLYHTQEIVNVGIWISSLDKDKTEGTATTHTHIRLLIDNMPEAFTEFIHNYCTALCAEKLVVESLIIPG
jgi:hypothetical protein